MSLSKKKMIELRKRTEEMLKFWSEYLIFLSIGFLGVYWITPQKLKIYSGITLLISFSISLGLFWAYNSYHLKTTKMIKEKN